MDLVFSTMGVLVVDVYKSAFDARNVLYLLLESLANVVSLTQRHVFRQDDVHLT